PAAWTASACGGRSLRSSPCAPRYSARPSIHSVIRIYHIVYASVVIDAQIVSVRNLSVRVVHPHDQHVPCKSGIIHPAAGKARNPAKGGAIPRLPSRPASIGG